MNKPEECMHDFLSGSVIGLGCILCGLYVEKTPDEVHISRFNRQYLPKNIPPEYAKYPADGQGN